MPFPSIRPAQPSPFFSIPNQPTNQPLKRFSHERQILTHGKSFAHNINSPTAIYSWRRTLLGLRAQTRLLQRDRYPAVYYHMGPAWVLLLPLPPKSSRERERERERERVRVCRLLVFARMMSLAKEASEKAGEFNLDWEKE